MKLLDQRLVVGPFQCNCRILVCPESGEGVVIDAGDESSKILRALDSLKTPTGAPVRIRYLLHTHGHLDHVGASREVIEALAPSQALLSSALPVSGADLKPQIALHSGDEPIYLALQQQGAMFGLQYADPLPVDHYLKDGEELKVGSMKFSVLHTPGHSPGSVCLRLEQNQALGIHETLFSGDTLFQGSVGRTDLWGADGDQMFRSIRQRILTLDGDIRVCPGHGPDTRVGVEKASNPFLT